MARVNQPCKLLNGLILPTSGNVYVKGMDTKIKQDMGYKTDTWWLQNPDNQIVATIIEEDIAFGFENLVFHRKK